MNIKRFIIIGLALMLTATGAFGQKFAFVDTDYILNNIPAYKSAQDQLDKLSENWQQEIEDRYAEIEEMYKDYQSESVLLSEEMKRQREEEIINKEKEVKQLQQRYFGPEGELYKKRQELVQPIQDEVYNAIKELSNERRYDAIFDTAAGATILFNNPEYDVSDMVLEKLGYRN